MILDQIRDLQKQQDEEAEKLGSFFSVSSRGGPNREFFISAFVNSSFC
jgi:hypothetical protein